MEEQPIINRVAGSALITFNLEDHYPKGERVIYDLSQNLFQGMILKEKDFRQFIKEHDFSAYQDKNVGIICSADAIIPSWAYMLLVNKMTPYANHVIVGDCDALEQSLFQKVLADIDVEDYRDKKIVVKGCGTLPVPTFAYAEVTRLLTPVVASLMFGEPCSTVPVYKRPRK